MYTTMWLEIYCWLAVSHMFHWKLDSRIKQCFFVLEWRRRETAHVLNRFVSWFLFLVFWLSFVAALTYEICCICGEQCHDCQQLSAHIDVWILIFLSGISDLLILLLINMYLFIQKRVLIHHSLIVRLNIDWFLLIISPLAFIYLTNYISNQYWFTNKACVIWSAYLLCIRCLADITLTPVYSRETSAVI